MYLRQRKGLDLGGDLLGRQAEIMPPGNAPNCDTGTRDVRSALTNLWRSLDQLANPTGYCEAPDSRLLADHVSAVTLVFEANIFE